MTKRPALIDIAEFHSGAAGGARPKSSVSVQFRLAPMAADADVETRAVPFVFSDNSVDAYGDTIDAKGWVFDRSGAGTVALFGHDSSKVENIIGRAHNVRVEGNQLLGDIFFATKEENPSAEIVYQLIKGGYVNSVSVGFQPMEWSMAKDKSRPGGIDFRKQKLLEISVVGIPANENAIAQARAAGIDVDRLKLAAVATRDAPVIGKKGLYSVSALAGVLADLGWIQDSTAWEAEYEGDGSEVPAMLLDAMKQLGAALVAMTAEEVAELLSGRDDDDIDVELVDGLVELEAPSEGQRAFASLIRVAAKARVAAGRRFVIESAKPLPATVVKNLGDALRAWNAGDVPALILDAGMHLTVLDADSPPVARAGAVLSKANKTTIQNAHATIIGACGDLQDMLDAIEPDDVTEKTAPSADEAERAARLRDLEILSVPQH